MRSAERGFSLLEVLIAAALFGVVALAAFATLRQSIAAAQRLGARHLALGTLERLSGQLRAEARSASAVWVGATAGSGHDDCTELDFYTADAGGPKFWSYRAFPNHAPAPRPGASPVPGADQIPGDVVLRVAGAAPLAPCAGSDPAQTVLTGLLAGPDGHGGFALSQVDPGTLGAHADPYLGGADSPFVQPAPAVPADPRVALGVAGADGTPVRGGNTLTELRLETADGSRAIDLLPGVFPGGFTASLDYACTARCLVGHDGGGAKTLTACAVSWSTDPTRYPQPVTAYRYDPASGSYVGTVQGYRWAVRFRFAYADPRPVPPGTGDRLDRYAVVDNFAGGGTLAPAAAPFDSSAGLADPQAWYAALRPLLSAPMQQAFERENAICAEVEAQRTGPGYYDNG